MWKTVSNIIGESFHAISVLLGSRDYARELKKILNSAERFMQWGKESNNPIDFQEVLALLDQAPLTSATNLDKLKIFHLRALSYNGIILSKELEMNKFNQSILKKYDTDEYMDDIINGISVKMKDLEAIIAAAEASDTIKLKALLGDKRATEVRPEEITLDARKEYDSIEDSFITKKSVKENKTNEINNFKTILVTEINNLQEIVLKIILEIDELEISLTPAEIEKKNQIKDDIKLNLQTIINKLNEAGIPLKPNKAKK
jgi:hypothetical protein